MSQEEIKLLKQQYATPKTFMDWVYQNILEPIGMPDFALDVCASADNHKAPTWYDEAQDGLKQSWLHDDGPAWCNPPFKDVEPWLVKASAEKTNRGVFSCVLTHMDHSTEWFNTGMQLASECILINPRINFVQHPKLLAYMAENKIKPGGNDKQNVLWVFNPSSTQRLAYIVYPPTWRKPK